MRHARSLLEIAALLAAFFLILPYIPSHAEYEFRFGIGQVSAITLFAVSRWLRWGREWWFVAVETAAFAVFVWVVVANYGLLWNG